MMQFQVKTETFEGPLDVLLDLIERRKLHINDVSLSQVTDDFLAHVKDLEEFNHGKVAHFVLVASTLLLIKSKSLLPGLSLTPEEQGDIKDLEERLLLLQKIRALSTNVKERFGKKIIFAKSENRIFQPVFSPDPEINKTSLLQSFRNVITAIPIKDLVPQAIVKKIISIEEMIERLTTRIQSSLKLSFKQFAGSKTERVEVIVGFLAMLELVKQGTILVAQEEHFGDIEMETAEIGTPRII